MRPGSRGRRLRVIGAAGLVAVTALTAARTGDVARGGVTQSAPSVNVVGAPTTSRGPKLIDELEELRSRTSRTYVDESGIRVARIFPGSVNFRDRRGEWKAIENDLVPVAGGYRNGANEWSARLPSRLDEGAVRIEHDDAWATLKLRDASGEIAVEGSRATYREAWPGVDAVYTVSGDEIKEDLVMRDRESVRDFAFDLRLAAGLSPRRVGRALRVGGAGGGRRFGLGAPTMIDASGAESAAVEVTLSREADRWVLRLSPDRRWLSEPDRVWPVTVDPPISPTPSRDCTISTPAAGSCSSSELKVGYGSTSSTQSRALLRFPVQEVLPADSEILAATLGLYFKRSSGGGTTASILGCAATKPWTDAATWTHFDTGQPWSTPGGDCSGGGLSFGPVGGSLGANRYYRANALTLTRGWLGGTTANHGVLLRNEDSLDTYLYFASVEATDPATRPYLEIQYTARTGERRGYQFEEFELSDRITLKVNAANGNLLLRQNDLTVPGGLGPDVVVGRSYNSMGTPTIYGDWRADYGDSWDSDTGQDFRLFQRPNDDAYFFGPSGYVVRFIRQSGNAYITPPGFDVTLTRDAGADPQPHTMTDHYSNIRWRFDSAGKLIRMTDRNGRELNFDYAAGDTRLLDRIIDAHGRVTSLRYDANGVIDMMTDPAGRTYNYDRAGGSTLRFYRNPNQGSTEYTYGGGRLTEVKTPGGRITRIVYYPTGHALAGRVESVTRVTPATTDVDPKTSFSYTINQNGSATSRVTDAVGNETTDPNDRITTYTFNTAGRVIKSSVVVNGRAREQEFDRYENSFSAQRYRSPSDAGTSNHSAEFERDSQDRMFRSKATLASGTISTETDWGGQDSGGGSAAGGAFLPHRERSEQDMAGPDPSGGAERSATGFEYTGEGNLSLVKKVNATGIQSSFAYRTTADAVDGRPGELRSITDARGNATTYRYDDGVAGSATAPLTRLTVTPPTDGTAGDALGPTVTRYDEFTNVNRVLTRPSSITDGLGNKQNFAYDVLDRVTEQAFYTPGGLEKLRIKSFYDADGNLTKQEDWVDQTLTRTYTFVYDALNRLASESGPGRNASYVYDGVGNLKSLTDAGGATTYGFDAANRQAFVDPPGSNAIDYEYDDYLGSGARSETVTFPADDPARNVRLVTVYDRYERISSIKATRGSNPGTVLQHLSYAYAQPTTGRQQALRTSETDERRGEVTEYRYADPLERLTEVWRRNSGSQTRLEDWEFFYDATSNIARRRHNTANTYFAYDANDRLCWRSVGSGAGNACGAPPSGATTHDYDAAGNETRGTGGRTATWTVGNQLRQLLISGDPNSPYGQTFAGEGQSDRLASGSLAISHNQLGIAGTTGGSAPGHYTRDAGGRLLAERSPTDAADRRAFVPDALGSTRTIIDRNGDVARRLNYDPWGQELACPSGDTCGSTFARFRFAGGFIDGTDLHHFGERFYDRQVGRWTQPDPLDLTGDLSQGNPYVYVGGDPVNRVDRGGLHGGGTDGCSIVPDYPLGFAFHQSCDGHDRCYAAQRGRRFCDRGFYRSLLSRCYRYDDSVRDNCYYLALVYYIGVRKFGGAPYRSYA